MSKKIRVRKYNRGLHDYKGHEIEVFDSGRRFGGMPLYGIRIDSEIGR